MKVTTFLKILWKDVKVSNDKAGKFLCKKGLAVHWIITLAKELPTN
jgi:hypothetical protein